jgi:hypothetical protein
MILGFPTIFSRSGVKFSTPWRKKQTIHQQQPGLFSSVNVILIEYYTASVTKEGLLWTFWHALTIFQIGCFFFLTDIHKSRNIYDNQCILPTTTTRMSLSGLRHLAYGIFLPFSTSMCWIIVAT